MRVKKGSGCAALRGTDIRYDGDDGTGGGRDQDQFGISCGGSGHGGRTEYSGPGNRSYPEKR